MGSFTKKKIKIWNDIYSSYKERCPESQRILQQVKKWQQNLEYEFKQLKQRSRSTREDGIQKIKEGFPYFNILSKERRESTTPDWQCRVLLLKCVKSMEQDNARFERSAEMFRDAQSRQMEQINAIVDIFKDLASK